MGHGTIQRFGEAKFIYWVFKYIPSYGCSYKYQHCMFIYLYVVRLPSKLLPLNETQQGFK